MRLAITISLPAPSNQAASLAQNGGQHGTADCDVRPERRQRAPGVRPVKTGGDDGEEGGDQCLMWPAPWNIAASCRKLATSSA
ncbi:hypothetical protein KIF59_05585 [Enterobacter cloacae subsp. cloacae]|nr:hypothetical protein [Enterobacter cloacae subsp. cloacae]